jgi:hypothetical protein
MIVEKSPWRLMTKGQNVKSPGYNTLLFIVNGLCYTRLVRGKPER